MEPSVGLWAGRASIPQVAWRVARHTSRACGRLASLSTQSSHADKVPMRPYHSGMSRPLEDVFKVSGVPTYTFVEPSSYDRLKVALRTPGRGLVVEGPSGIGKSTAVARALEILGNNGNVEQLSARD